MKWKLGWEGFWVLGRVLLRVCQSEVQDSPDVICMETLESPYYDPYVSLRPLIFRISPLATLDGAPSMLRCLEI